MPGRGAWNPDWRGFVRGLGHDRDKAGAGAAKSCPDGRRALDAGAGPGFISAMSDLPFWQTKALDEMTRAEWESLCDGCAKCCLTKLEDIDTLELAYTNVVCSLLDGDKCQCTDYANRSVRVPDCVTLTPQSLAEIDWMPASCAYRLIRDGKDLPSWHPLKTGRRESVHEAGMSVRGRTVPEHEVVFEDLEDYIVDWPMDVAE